MSSEIATIIFMSQHKRLGEKSILKLLDPEILSIILSHGDIIQYNTTIHPIYSTPKMIHLERILKNTKNYPISNIVENNGEIYTVSSNNIIKTSNESTTLINGKKSIIQYIDVKDNIVLCVMKIYTTNHEYLNIIIYTKDNFDIIFHYIMNSIFIYNPIIVDDKYLFIVNEYKIKKFDIKTNKIIWKYKLENKITCTYYYNDKNNLYMMTNIDKVYRINLKTLKIESSSTIDAKNVIVYHVDKLYTYTIYNNKTLITFNENYDKYIYYVSNSNIDYAPIIIDLKSYIIITHKYKTIKYMIGTNIYRWVVSLKNEITHRAIINIDKTYMYVSTSDSYVHKISVQDGTIIWSIKVRGKIIGNMLIKDKHLFIQTTNPSNLYRLFT